MKQLQNNNYFLLKIWLLAIVYAVGLFGFFEIIPFENFGKLTPLNLLFSAIILFSHHKPINLSWVIFFVVVFVWGFLIEWVGVVSGVVFGTYSYGESLGLKIFDIPVIIGLNWVMLVYISGITAMKFSDNFFGRAWIGAGLMVLLDVFIEPFAMRHDLWNWEGGMVPFQNYAAWFFCGFLMQLLFFKMNISKVNVLAPVLYVIQLIFFGVLLFA